jgi:hypothetical protein
MRPISGRDMLEKWFRNRSFEAAPAKTVRARICRELLCMPSFLQPPSSVLSIASSELLSDRAPEPDNFSTSVSSPSSVSERLRWSTLGSLPHADKSQASMIRRS